MESRIDHRLSEHDRRIKELSGKVESFLKTSLPPCEGILFEGQIFDAHVFVSNLIKHADKHIILIDKYIDKTVLALMDKRKRGVTATIYTKRIDSRLLLGLERHNDQYPTPVNVRTATNVHDRFMVIDDTLSLSYRRIDKRPRQELLRLLPYGGPPPPLSFATFERTIRDKASLPDALRKHSSGTRSSRCHE